MKGTDRGKVLSGGGANLDAAAAQRADLGETLI
jgi:hypothetical protein